MTSARGLVVVCREPSPSAQLITLGRRYLYFLAQAQAADGKFRSRLGVDRRWHGPPEAQDSWGRSLWALGTAAAGGPTAGIRQEALALDASAAVGSLPPCHGVRGARRRRDTRAIARPSRRAGAAHSRQHRHRRACSCPCGVLAWLAPRLSYANAAIAEAVIAIGEKLGRDDLLRNGLRMLGWLLAGETRNGHLSVVPAGGWGARRGPPLFRPAPEPGGGARGRLRAGGGGHRRHRLADRRGNERDLAARRQRRPDSDARRANRRVQRRPQPQ